MKGSGNSKTVKKKESMIESREIKEDETMENDLTIDGLPFKSDNFAMNIDYDTVGYEHEDDLFSGLETIVLEDTDDFENFVATTNETDSHSKKEEVAATSQPHVESNDSINYLDELIEELSSERPENQYCYFLPPQPPLPRCRSISPDPSVLPTFFCETDDFLSSCENEDDEFSLSPPGKRWFTDNSGGNNDQFRSVSGPLTSRSIFDFSPPKPVLPRIDPQTRNAISSSSSSVNNNRSKKKDGDGEYTPLSGQRKRKGRNHAKNITNSTTRTSPSVSKSESNKKSQPKNDKQKQKKRRKSQDNGQILCSVLSCQNKVQNRLRFSMRCLNKDSDFKQEYRKKSWDKVCHYHYFADLYKSKKMEKQKLQEQKKMMMKMSI